MNTGLWRCQGRRKARLQWVRPVRTRFGWVLTGLSSSNFTAPRPPRTPDCWAYRELDELLGLTEMAESLLHDWRTGRNTRQAMVGLLPDKLIKVAPKVVTHARYTMFQMAGLAIPRPANLVPAIIGADVGPKNSNIVVGASKGVRYNKEQIARRYSRARLSGKSQVNGVGCPWRLARQYPYRRHPACLTQKAWIQPAVRSFPHQRPQTGVV